MKEVKDHEEIKLFGKKICLKMDNGDGDDVIHAGDDFSGDSGRSSCELLSEVVEESGIGTENEDEKENCKSLPDVVVVEESQNIEGVSVCEDNSMDEGVEENDQGDMNNNTDNNDDSQQKTLLKKPDKIVPCPRCNSMDTKFCYYNNYNVNQPRHFCKSCQRYWTAGGTMRNVPVGAGRRKNKNFLPSNCHSITVSEAYQGGDQIDAPNGFHHHPKFRPNGSILSFGQEALPLCDPVSSVLNMTNKNAVNGGSNGFYQLDQVGNGTNCSSVKVHHGQGANNGQQEPVLQQMNGFSHPVPYLPGVPWPYPWNPAVPMQAFCPPGYHMPIYPTPVWNYNMNGPWSFPWLPPPPNSASTLGKHSRNGQVIRSQESEGGVTQETRCSEGSVLVPKTLRIDDPEEAAKSSIWTTLGIKYDSVSYRGGGLFKAFEQKTSEKKCSSPSASPAALQVNPAALSRSLIFQERA